MTDGSVQNEVSVSTHSWSSKMAYSETAFRSLSSKGISRKSSMKHWPSVSSCPLLPFTARSPTAMNFHLPISELFTPHYINVLQKCETSRKLLSPPFFLNSYINLRKITWLSAISLIFTLEQQQKILIKVAIIKIVQVTMRRLRKTRNDDI